MHSQELNALFMRWLSIAMEDEEWRAFIRARLNECELPVIELTEETAICLSQRNG